MYMHIQPVPILYFRWWPIIKSKPEAAPTLVVPEVNQSIYFIQSQQLLNGTSTISALVLKEDSNALI